MNSWIPAVEVHSDFFDESSGTTASTFVGGRSRPQWPLLEMRLQIASTDLPLLNADRSELPPKTGPVIRWLLPVENYERRRSDEEEPVQ